MPKRLRLSRAKGFKLPEGARSVARPHKYGNPYVVGQGLSQHKAVALFREGIIMFGGFKGVDGVFISVAEIRRELRGRDLACWCHLTDPCHAEVLMTVANSRGALKAERRPGPIGIGEMPSLVSGQLAPAEETYSRESFTFILDEGITS